VSQLQDSEWLNLEQQQQQQHQHQQHQQQLSEGLLVPAAIILEDAACGPPNTLPHTTIDSSKAQGFSFSPRPESSSKLSSTQAYTFQDEPEGTAYPTPAQVFSGSCNGASIQLIPASSHKAHTQSEGNVLLEIGCPQSSNFMSPFATSNTSHEGSIDCEHLALISSETCCPGACLIQPSRAQVPRVPLTMRNTPALASSRSGGGSQVDCLDSSLSGPLARTNAIQLSNSALSRIHPICNHASGDYKR